MPTDLCLRLVPFADPAAGACCSSAAQFGTADLASAFAFARGLTCFPEGAFAFAFALAAAPGFLPRFFCSAGWSAADAAM